MERPITWEGFSKFANSKTGRFLLGLLIIAAGTKIYSEAETSPDKFSDLGTRFKVETTVTPYGFYDLAVYRRAGTPVRWYDNDLVALERDVIAKCGELSKLLNTPPDSEGYFPVYLRLHNRTALQNCSYIPEALR